MKFYRASATTILSICSALSINLAVSAETIFTPHPSDLTPQEDLAYPGSINVLDVKLTTVIDTSTEVCEVGDYSGCTLIDVNADADSLDSFKPEVKVKFQADDFGDDGSISNATLRVRGDSTRLSNQKSYRIKLDSKKNLWRDERKLQLNKHPYDLSRVSNKFSFDLMFPIPNLPSLRTQFVNLTIDDVPYGLFTHVENVGKEYLEKRGLDKDTPLYKAIETYFVVQEGMKLDANGEPLDLDAFEQVFEIKRGKNHSKLIEMLGAIDNDTNDFKVDVFDKYFNRNNYLTWLAVNILIGNHDTTDRNFYLLNPIDTDTFYFLPWDYDDGWGFYNQPSEMAGEPLPRWHQGLGTWWVQPLHQRYFSQPGALKEITEAVAEIKENYFQAGVMQQTLDRYHDVIFPLISSSPDIDDLPVLANASDEAILGEYDTIYGQIAGIAEKNYQSFLAEIENPMTFFLDRPIESGTSVKFEWSTSVDLQGDVVVYDIAVASSPDFSQDSILYSAEGLSDTNYSVEWENPNGQYFYRVIARQENDPDNRWQVTPKTYVDPATDQTYENVYLFEVKAVNAPSTDGDTAVDGTETAAASSSGGGATSPLSLLLLLFIGFAYRRQQRLL